MQLSKADPMENTRCCHSSTLTIGTLEMTAVSNPRNTISRDLEVAGKKIRDDVLIVQEINSFATA